MFWNREHISEGMTVRSKDGEKLGKVISMGEGTFEIEKGFFILKDYVVPYSDIEDIRDGECFLRYGKEALQRAGEELPAEEERSTGAASSPTTTAAATGAGALAADQAREDRREEFLAELHPLRSDEPNLGAVEEVQTTTQVTSFGEEPVQMSQFEEERSIDEPITGAELLGGRSPERRQVRGTGEETTIPLAHERLAVAKHDTKTGEIHIHKTVETETETIEVPLRREKVSVEHFPASAAAEAGAAGAGAFREEDISIPVYAEEVEVAKETVVDEELHVIKTPYEEKRRVSEKVRRERAEVRADSDDDLEKGRSLGWKGTDPNTRY